VTLHGIWGLPFIDLAPLLDTAPLAAVDEEIALGLTRVQPSYTGGTLKWMGVVAPPVHHDGHPDAMQVIRGLSRNDFARFVSLADDPGAFDPDRRAEYAFGDETDHPLTKAQMLWLKYRHGVYFPWKVAYHFLENELWEDKNSGEGKSFRGEARRVFPRTVAFLESLPFREIGRAVLFGLESHDHAPLHRDTVPGSKGVGRSPQGAAANTDVDHCITIAPRRGKRFFLSDPALRTRRVVDTPLYWFNDMDWHGVEPDPFFRYSIRVDGVFQPEFLADLRRHVAATIGA
jgi:Rieske 2Fe-2S family protein